MLTPMHKETVDRIKDAIEGCVLLTWRDYGFSIVRFGQLERIESYAYSQAYEFHKYPGIKPEMTAQVRSIGWYYAS